LTEVFVQIALGLAGFAGDAMYEVYKSYDDVMGGSVVQGLMRQAGFNVEKAAALSKRSRGLDKAAGFSTGGNISSFEGSKLLEAMKGSKEDTTDHSYVGTFIDNYKNFKKNASEGSPVYKFLNSKKVMSAFSYVSNEGNFRNNRYLNFVGTLYDDAEDPQRAQYILELLNRAYQIEAVMPQAIYNKANSNKKFNSTYIKRLSEANNLASSLSEDIPDPEQVGSMFDLDFTASNDDVVDKILSVQNQASRAQINLSKALKNKTYNVDDGFFKGKDATMLVGNNVLKFHPDDEIVAAKKGGYFNNLFIDFSQKYDGALHTSKNANIKTAKALVKSNALATTLSSNIIKYNDYADDVSEKEMLELFNTSIDLVKKNAERKVIASNVKLKVV